MAIFDDDEVRPDGLSVRRLRHERGWSPRRLVDAISSASFASTGVRRTITPNLLTGIEERNEPIPYEILCLVSDGFDCDPIDLLLPEDFDEQGDDPNETGGADGADGADEAAGRKSANRHG